MKPSAEYPQPLTLHSPRLLLRPMQLADAAAILRWRNRPEDSVSFALQRELTLADHLAWFTGPRLGRVDYMIQQRSDERFIGTLHFKNINQENHSAESGRLIGELDCRGKGYGLESAKAWYAYGYHQLGLHIIYGLTHESNKVNIALNRSLGSVFVTDSSVPTGFVKMRLDLAEAMQKGVLDLPL